MQWRWYPKDEKVHNPKQKSFNDLWDQTIGNIILSIIFRQRRKKFFFIEKRGRDFLEYAKKKSWNKTLAAPWKKSYVKPCL